MPFRLADVTWREWAALAAGIVAVVGLFLPWTVLQAADPQVADALRALPDGEVARSAWRSGFFAWSSPLVLLVAGIAAAGFGQRAAVRVAGLPQVWLIAAGLALLLFVIGWFTMDWQFGAEQRALLAESGVTMRPGLGRYLGAGAVLVSLGAAAADVRAFQAERTRA